MVVRARIKTLPSRQALVGREFNRLVNARLAAEGIAFPRSDLTCVRGKRSRGFRAICAMRNAPARTLVEGSLFVLFSQRNALFPLFQESKFHDLLTSDRRYLTQAERS